MNHKKWSTKIKDFFIKRDQIRSFPVDLVTFTDKKP